MRGRLWFPAGVAALSLLTGCGGAADEGATIPIRITTSNFTFSPDAIDVEPGEEVDVVLINEDDTPHSFTAEGIDITAEPDATITGSFSVPASDVPFRCKFHPQMTGVLSIGGTSGGEGGEVSPPAGDQDIDY